MAGSWSASWDTGCEAVLIQPVGDCGLCFLSRKQGCAKHDFTNTCQRSTLFRSLDSRTETYIQYAVHYAPA